MTFEEIHQKAMQMVEMILNMITYNNPRLIIGLDRSNHRPFI